MAPDGDGKAALAEPVAPHLTVSTSVKKKTKWGKESMDVNRPDVALVSGGNRQQGCTKIFLLVFFSIFLLVGSILFVVFSGLPLYRSSTSKSWPQAECKITKSSVGSHRGEDGTTYSIDIEFDYEYLNKKYHSDRYSFSSGSSSGSKSKHDVVRAYPVGSNHQCFVNPAKPEMAVLNRKPTSDMYFGLLTLVFVFVGGGGIIGVFIYKPKPPGETTWLPDQTTSSDAITDGPATLKPESSPLVQFFVLLAVTLFWCGIVSIFTYHEIAAFRKGNPEWFLSVFLIPFQLIGLVLATITFLTFLTIFNPVPVLQVNSTQLALGDTLEVGWSFEGRTSSIRRLTITLIGTESAQYRRGTSTYTDESIFFQTDLYDTTSPVEIAQGSAEIEVPVTTMHSFDGGHNSIDWTLKVHGDIGLWPDIDASFPLVINPFFI